ncbi:MAG TPA: sigma-70 family RNA polymerase sigma factor, partial [Fimbriiglobus sp.]|nr:sigma-70 family RNA polymerase sigma factor [Fimbriiglobus sp.]
MTPLPIVYRHLARAAEVSDAELLTRFADTRDEAAFAALVARHGPMVLGVCRSLLSDHATAEDAFQAAFLALARNVGAVRDRAAVAGWLHAAAVRVARKARTRSARARRAPVVVPSSPRDPLDALTGRELLALIDEEIARLPESLRAAVVACVVQGLSQEAAARRLGWSPGSLKGRLERGREKLRRALVRRGVAPTAVLAATIGATQAVSA